MDWVTQTLGFGFLALPLFGLSVLFAWRKKYKLGLLFGGLELISGGVSCAAWAWALKVSGKADWFLLGLLGYTPAALIFYAMLVVGIVCLIANFRGLVRVLDASMDQK